MTKPAATSDWRDNEPVARLTYPFEQTPVHGEALDIAPGVKWMRMPLGGSLQFINVWALKDQGGWTIVDTGIAGPDSAKAWRTIFADHLNGEPVTRIIVTHMHPDHLGMAGWIAKKFQCRLWITRLEYLMCRVLSADTGRAAPEEGIAFYRTAGWDTEDLDHYRSRFGGFGRGMHQLPDSYRRISDGEVIRIGDHDWSVVVGNGHSPEHACLYCAELNLFISGDQVLPRISSNVSVFPTEPDGDPLDDWLASLKKLQREIPPDVLVLPAHNDPFLGLHRRLEHLTNGHERALNRLEKALVEPKRAVDVFGLLFKRRIDADQKGMATGEAVAHLNCLMHRKKVVREADADGVWWYRTVA